MTLLIGAVTGAFLTALGAIFVAIINGRSSPYGELAKRVLVLEQQVNGLRNENSLLVLNILAFQRWVEGGAEPPAPSILPDLRHLFNQETNEHSEP